MLDSSFKIGDLLPVAVELAASNAATFPSTENTRLAYRCRRRLSRTANAAGAFSRLYGEPEQPVKRFSLTSPECARYANSHAVFTVSKK